MKCIKCGETSESEFYPSQLRRSIYRCKSCIAKYNRQWIKNNPERWRKYFREYMREYMRNHPEVNKENFRKWYSKNADVHYERTLAYAQADPQRHNAQGCAFKAFPDAQVCEMDGCAELGERHHDDYSQPYKIRWLCRRHHRELHRKYKAEVGILG